MATIAELEAQMTAAVEAEDFEAAARLRDEIEALTPFRKPTLDEMGIANAQAYHPPKGWKPPRRPDPMTKGHKPAKRKR